MSSKESTQSSQYTNKSRHASISFCLSLSVSLSFYQPLSLSLSLFTPPPLFLFLWVLQDSCLDHQTSNTSPIFACMCLNLRALSSEQFTGTDERLSVCVCVCDLGFDKPHHFLLRWIVFTFYHIIFPLNSISLQPKAGFWKTQLIHYSA